MAAPIPESPSPIVNGNNNNANGHHQHHHQDQSQPQQQRNGHSNGSSTASTNTRSTTREEERPSPYYYLTADAAEAIPKYQYKGEDRSLLYKYILSPLAQYLVDHWTPRNVAPNAITLLGLMLMVAAYSFVWYYVPDLQVHPSGEGEDESEAVPRWIFLYNCIAMLIYQTLDNMDGKQARRTKSSSPLGLLFDHGCDAINSIFGSANWIVAMGLNPWEDTFLCWFLVVGPYALFYIATWEEYYTGELILPIANGPNEGLFGGAMLSLTTYFYGQQFWLGYSGFDNVVLPLLSFVMTPETAYQSLRIRNADLLGMISVVGIFQEAFLKSLHVSRTYGLKAMMDSLPFFVVSLATFIIGWYDESIWAEIPRTALHLYACLVVEMVTELMRAHITNQKFCPLQRWINYPLLFLTGVIVICALVGCDRPPTWIKDYLIIYTTAACTYLAMKLTIIVDEICRVLNIWCFDIVTPRQKIQQHHLIENHRIKAD